jgi:hypothetical protein
MEELPGIDTSVPHSARIYDYILGYRSSAGPLRSSRGSSPVWTSFRPESSS